VDATASSALQLNEYEVVDGNGSSSEEQETPQGDQEEAGAAEYFHSFNQQKAKAEEDEKSTQLRPRGLSHAAFGEPGDVRAGQAEQQEPFASEDGDDADQLFDLAKEQHEKRKKAHEEYRRKKERGLEEERKKKKREREEERKKKKEAERKEKEEKKKEEAEKKEKVERKDKEERREKEVERKEKEEKNKQEAEKKKKEERREKEAERKEKETTTTTTSSTTTEEPTTTTTEEPTTTTEEPTTTTEEPTTTTEEPTTTTEEPTTTTEEPATTTEEPTTTTEEPTTTTTTTSGTTTEAPFDYDIWVRKIRSGEVQEFTRQEIEFMGGRTGYLGSRNINPPTPAITSETAGDESDNPDLEIYKLKKLGLAAKTPTPESPDHVDRDERGLPPGANSQEYVDSHAEEVKIHPRTLHSAAYKAHEEGKDPATVRSQKEEWKKHKEEWDQKEKEREERIARGEDVDHDGVTVSWTTPSGTKKTETETWEREALRLSSSTAASFLDIASAGVDSSFLEEGGSGSGSSSSSSIKASTALRGGGRTVSAYSRMEEHQGVLDKVPPPEGSGQPSEAPRNAFTEIPRLAEESIGKKNLRSPARSSSSSSSRSPTSPSESEWQSAAESESESDSVRQLFLVALASCALLTGVLLLRARRSGRQTVGETTVV